MTKNWEVAPRNITCRVTVIRTTLSPESKVGWNVEHISLSPVMIATENV
jgi:hypothetical protein